MLKVAVFLADGFEELEAVTVVDILRRGEVNVLTVSIMPDLKVVGSHGIEFTADKMFDANALKDFDMVVLPGGLGGMNNLKAHEGVNAICREFASGDKYVCAICAAPTVLGCAGILRGRTAVCYPGFEKYLEGATIGNGNVVTDGKIITSKGPGTAIEFAFELLTVIKGKEVADQVKAGMLLK